MNTRLAQCSFFVALQGSYTGLSLALFEHDHCLEKRIYTDKKASSHLVPFLDQLLYDHELTLNDLNFLAVDKGPGAFTSLRVTLATVNGIALSKKIMLVGISGLEALYRQIMLKEPAVKTTSTLILLNAYNNDCYYLFSSQKHTHDYEIGCASIETIITKYAEKPDQQTPLYCAGNALLLHKQLILEQLSPTRTVIMLSDELADAQSIGLCALENPEKVACIEPLYLKTQLFAVKK